MKSYADMLKELEQRAEDMAREAMSIQNPDDPKEVGEAFFRACPEEELLPGETVEDVGQEIIDARNEINQYIKEKYGHDQEA
jgi:hypothetical protein